MKKSALKGTQKDHEYALIERLHGAVDETVDVVLRADRGSGERKLHDVPGLIGWNFVIRSRGG